MLDAIEYVLNWCTKNWESITLVGTGVLTFIVTSKSKTVTSARTIDLGERAAEIKKLAQENATLKNEIATQNLKIDTLSEEVKNLAGICYSGFMNSNIRYKNDVQHYYDNITKDTKNVKETECKAEVTPSEESIPVEAPEKVINKFIEARKHKYGKKN